VLNGPIADTDLEQRNVRFGEKQTIIQIKSPATTAVMTAPGTTPLDSQ
jgi:hypothetical protein